MWLGFGPDACEGVHKQRPAFVFGCGSRLQGCTFKQALDLEARWACLVSNAWLLLLGDCSKEALVEVLGMNKAQSIARNLATHPFRGNPENVYGKYKWKKKEKVVQQ